MPTHLEELRSRFAISQLCQVFEATLHLCLEEGFPRHQLHYMPSPIILEEAGRKVILPEPQVGCLYGLTRYSPLKIPVEDETAFARNPPFESLLLAMPISDGPKLMAQRTRLLQESERLFLDLAEQGDRVVVVCISHRRLIHRRIVLRHQPAALFDLSSKLLWLHPAGPQFGLVAAIFPRSQRHRHLAPAHSRPQERSAFLKHDEEGLPAWVDEARQALREDGEEDPVTDAFLEYQGRNLLQISLVEEAEERMHSLAQSFLADFERYFGAGGLMPMPGHLDKA